MWCKHCRQDVPGIAASSQLLVSCSRCGAILSSAGEPDVEPAISAAEAAGAGLDDGSHRSSLSGYPNFDDWAIEQNLRHLQARVGRRSGPNQSERASARKADRKPIRRIHAAHQKGPRPHRPRPTTRRRTSLVDHLIWTLELMAFACGGVLLAWSFTGMYTELWRLGVPIEVAGQASVMLGVMLQLERIWQHGRYAVKKLDQVDVQLHSLQQTADLLGMTHTSAAQAFYAHMADEADPHLLLADLKGQLDLVAMSLSKRSA
jgi:hypothetical protein